MTVTTGVDASTRTVVPLTSEHPLARVDLLPPEVIADRRFKTARGWMVVAVVGTVGLAGGAFFLASADADTAAEELAAEQARTATLQTEAAQYAAVPAILASVDRAETALDTAMATDVEWYRYLSQMGSVTPEGVWFSSITLTTATAVAGPVTDPLAPVDAIGDVVTVGRALSYGDVATWMDSVSDVAGYDHVLFSSTDLQDEEAQSAPFVDFTVTVKVLPEAFSDRYVSKAE